MTRCPNLCAFILQQSTKERQTTTNRLAMQQSATAANFFRHRDLFPKQTPSYFQAISTLYQENERYKVGWTAELSLLSSCVLLRFLKHHIKEDRGIYLMDMSGDLSRRTSKHGKHSRRKSKVETPSSLTIIELAISTPASSLFRQDVCSVQHITTTSVF